MALVVSDMRMPGMNGAELLTKVQTLYPNTVRMVLSGQADPESTIAAVNEGQIYRFLTKPCSEEVLRKAGHGGQVGIQLGADLGNVLPVTAGHPHCALDNPIQIGTDEVPGRVGKLPHGAHNLADPLHAFQGLADGHGHLRLQIIRIGRAESPGQLAHRDSAIACGLHQTRDLRQKDGDRAEGSIEEADVPADILGGCIDLVGDAGCQLTNGLQFLCLSKLGLEPESLGNVVQDHDIAGYQSVITHHR